MKTRSIKYLLLAVMAIALLLPLPALSTIQWTNNATSVVANAGGLAAGGTSLTVTAGHGDRFPAVATPHYFMVTLVDTSGNREIVKVTTRVALSNTMTIVRAQEGTSARDFPIGSLVELRVTKNALDYLSKSADIEANHYVADASALDQGATTNSLSIKSLVDAIGTQQATIEIPHTGTGTTTTYTVSTGFTIPVTISLKISKGALISVAGGQTVTMNGIVQAGAYAIFTGAGTTTVSTYPQNQAWWGSAGRFDAKVNLVQGSDADGDMYYRASGATTRLAKGTGLQQLRMNVGATAPEWGSAGVPMNYLTGLGLSNAADTDHDITIAVGTARDSANAYDLPLASPLTKQIDAAWAAGTNAGGMFTGAVGVTTWYHVFLIRKDADGTIDAGFDTSVTAANKPAGYSNYRRIGSVKTDGSSNIVQFYQYGDSFQWKAVFSDCDQNNPGVAAVLVTLSVPLGVVTKAMMNFRVNNQAAAVDDCYVSDPNVNDEAPNLNYLDTILVYVVGQPGASYVEMGTNTSSQIRYRLRGSGAGTNVKIGTKGYIDRRGRDD